MQGDAYSGSISAADTLPIGSAAIIGSTAAEVERDGGFALIAFGAAALSGGLVGVVLTLMTLAAFGFF